MDHDPEAATAVEAHRQVKLAAQALAEDADPNKRFFVDWQRITEHDWSEFQHAVRTATNEQDMQAYLEHHPLLLIQHLGGGAGRWVIPGKRLGSEHVTDFLIGDQDSIGYHWVAVELESPLAKPYTKTGDDSARLSHARRQIDDWRMWLRSNGDYAHRSRSNKGLGLPAISEAMPGLIIIGRRSDSNVHPDVPMRRRQWKEHYGIEVHSFDWLVDKVREASVRP